MAALQKQASSKQVKERNDRKKDENKKHNITELM